MAPRLSRALHDDVVPVGFAQSASNARPPRGAKHAHRGVAAVALFGTVAALALAPRVAEAQARDGQARGMVRQALEDYQNLDVDGAMNRLRLAVNLCGTRNCSPAVSARVHMAMGVVAVGGQNDSTTGVNEFTAALRLDNTAEPDAMLVTPEITAALAQARQRLGRGGSSSGTPEPTPTPTPMLGPAGTLLHTAIAEQLENTPVPVYVEPGSVRATRYVVRYRGLGMSNYAELDLTSIGGGFGGEIPCGQVIQPSIEYYVAALDASGAVVGTAGSATTPQRVSVVRARTRPAPALPGRMPPEQCGEDCPPGMSGPQCRSRGGASGGTRQLGDPCERDDQCSSGLRCDAGSCSSGEANRTPAPPSNRYRVAFDLGAGLGAGLLSGSTNANPTTWGDPMPPLTSRIRSDLSYAEFSRNTGACRDGISCPQSVSTGFAPAGFLYFAFRVSPFRMPTLERLAFAVNARFQWDYAVDEMNRPVGTLPMLFIGGRLLFALTPNAWQRNGPVVAVFAGSGVGQMQVRPLPPSSTPNAATGHFINGLNNAHVGARFEYNFGNIGHIGADLTANIQIPNFMFVLDLQGTVGVHF